LISEKDLKSLMSDMSVVNDAMPMYNKAFTVTQLSFLNM
jgi:hypothetical protein